MVLPIIILITIPIFLGIVFVPPFEPVEEINDELIPFDQSEEINDELIPEEPDVNILYFLLMIIWVIILIRILRQMKKGTFKITRRY